MKAARRMSAIQNRESGNDLTKKEKGIPYIGLKRKT
jgi:hypothetical protein